MKKYLIISVILLVNSVLNCTELVAQYSSANLLPGETGTIILRGTIILPDRVVKHGYVTIANGLIVSITDNPPKIPNAISVNTHGIILPSFVDVHNHVPFNVLPRWKPSQLYTNRNQWRNLPEVNQKVTGPIDQIEPTHICEMNNWSELRALVGGTTSIMVTRPVPCINGLVRNLDYNSGFYGTTQLDREHIFNVLDLPPASNPAARAAFVGAANFFIANPFYEALFIHLAEGTDAAAEEEFTFMQSQSLLNPKGVVIHGVSLTAPDLQAMAAAGTALVWSPRSNLELYGQTANILAALDAGVEIALAPDWAVTGSSNMLNELKVAAEWNRQRLGGRLNNRQLVDMVTTNAAHIAGIDDHVGAIKPGLRADLLVINGKNTDALGSVINAGVADVNLVFINGVPLYGDHNFMLRFWNPLQLEKIELPGAVKFLATPAVNLNVAAIKSSLELALSRAGSSLAPLAEPNDFLLPLSIQQSISRSSVKIAPNIKKDDLSVFAFANPSQGRFTLKTQSSSDKLLQVSVINALGTVVERTNSIRANTTFHIGNSLRPGIYLIKVVQGRQQKILKLIRQ